MKKLLSFIATKNHLKEVDSWLGLDKILKDHDFDGIEIMTGGFYNVDKVSTVKSVGHHLLYFPSWIHMWLEDVEELEKEYGSVGEAIKVYGGFGRKGIIEFYKRELEDTIKLKSEYIVFHVGHVGIDEVFGDNFKYGKLEVLKYTAELLNEIFKGVGDGPLLLLENLWWPGMDLLSESETSNFFKSINYPNKGIMFDISHFSLLDKNIESYNELMEFVENRILSSNILRKYIKGIHLNSTFPSEYIKNKSIENENKLSKLEDRMERYKVIIDHITSLDTHDIYADFSINKIMENLNIEYLVFEFKWKDRDDLISKIEEQKYFLNLSK